MAYIKDREMGVTGYTQRQGGVYLCQAPGGMVARGSGCAHRFSPKLRQPRHRFSVGLKGCRQQHLAPEPFIKKNNNYDGITKIVLFLTIGRPGITAQMEQMYTRRLQKQCSIGEWQR